MDLQVHTSGIVVTMYIRQSQGMNLCFREVKSYERIKDC